MTDATMHGDAPDEMARARWWFNLAFYLWTAFWVCIELILLDKWGARRVIPLLFMTGLMPFYAIYVSRGLACGRRFGAAAGLLGLLALIHVPGSAASVYRHSAGWAEWNWAGWFATVIVYGTACAIACVVVFALWTVVAALREAAAEP